jgi:predicted CxxxxCH...CXXCH cytochrome family protein
MRILDFFGKTAAVLAVAAALWGCSSSNSSAPSLDASGKHPANWLVDHRPSFLNDSSQCMQCHGSDLRGGISKVSCFSPLFGGQACHANGPSGHPAGWREPGLHGAAAKSQPGTSTGFSSCRACHGADFAGGIARVSCFSASSANGACHVRNGAPVNAPHAPLPWRTYPSPTHTDTIDDAAGLNAAACALCHTRGGNLRTQIITTFASGTPGCFNSTLCHGVTGHPLGWANPDNHGSAAKANLIFCQQCHADNPLGGPGSNPRFNVQLGRLIDGANTGCEVCHAPRAPHPRVLQIPAAFGSIATINPLGTPWFRHRTATNFDACNRCHGAGFDGVGAVAGATGCTSCHRSGLPLTLFNCTSCHGRPPSGTVYPNRAFAHATHATINVADVCGECHNGLGTGTLDHFLRTRARTAGTQPGAVQFGAFARTGGVTPVFNAANLQCSNTYCHGATRVGGTDKAPRWNDANYLAAAGCGTCHGFPPATPSHGGFTAATSCKTCHQHVNTTNNGFDDPTRHVNGVIDVTGGIPHAFPNPGANHLTAAGQAPFPGCVVSACHANSTTGRGVYPVAVGTPPNCQGCHTKQSPGNSCGSCHGVASISATIAGRPTGNAFPDVEGGHDISDHNVACSLCHGANGTGHVDHGPSNRIAHGDADVNIEFTGEAAGITFTRSGLGDGRGTCNGNCHGEDHENFNW